MDDATIAATAVAHIVPFLTGEKADVPGKAGHSLLSVIRANADGSLGQALRELEGAPAEEDNQTLFRIQLKKNWSIMRRSAMSWPR